MRRSDEPLTPLEEALCALIPLLVRQRPPTPSPGFLCEACLDAPAVTTAPAPWGGEMGLCWACEEREHQPPAKNSAHGGPGYE